jgi:CHAT domain-containing protein/predicted negative regulator of RcsB-dependent stress response
MAQAEVLRANWNETSLRQSAEQFDRAALIWRSLGDFSHASRAALKSGDAYFDFSELSEALKRYQDAANLASKNQDWLAEAMALTKLARVDSYLGHNDVAQKHITRALDLLKVDQRNLIPDAKNAYGEALTTLGELAYERGNFKNARTNFDEALKFLDGDQSGQARVHIFKGYIAGTIGDSETAVEEISKALELYRAINNKAGEGQALTALGLANSFKGDPNVAIQRHNEAREIFRSIGDRHSEAIAINALGQAYENVGSYPLALKHYEQALQLFEDIGAVNGIVPSNCNVARIHFLSKRFDQADTYYQRCLNLSRTAGTIRNEIFALSEMVKNHDPETLDFALALSKRIQKFCEATGDRRGLAQALNVYGDLLFEKRQKPGALNAYERARSLSEEIGDKETLIVALAGLARTNLALGTPESALSIIQRSLAIIEDLRANVASPEFRTSYFSGVRRHYDLCIEILAQLERLHPGKGFAAQAFIVSEKSRARLLLDLVSESRANIRASASKELLEQERELRALIRIQAERLLDLASSQKDAPERAETENQLDQLKAQYQAIEAQIRQQNPYLSSLEKFVPKSLEQIQKELCDGDAMLLEYSLGDERSFLWEVTSDSVQMHELPARKIIEDTTRELYALITAREGQNGSDYQAKIDAAENRLPEIESRMGQMLLGQVAERLGHRRLVIVAEGAVQLIPFAALRVPMAQNVASENDPPTRLVETHEIIVEPSLSALMAIHNNKPHHVSSPGKLVAIIADPVLSGSDDRVQSKPLAPSTALAATDDKPSPMFESLTRAGSLTRLAHASEEADEISAAAPMFTTMIAKGFDANRETAMSPDVGQYQIVHFATHSFVDTEHPELSGIVLTMVDRNGVKTDGFMSLHDIYSLDLSAELTVLSACETALGKDIKGEGLVGLSHALMSAGSKSVVGSLWKVDDRATAVLMGNLYKSMLQQGMSPAAALRSAQLTMMRNEQYKAPYYWAGFVIQGDYTNRIAVDHNPSFRVALVLLFLLGLVAAGVLILQKRKRRISSTQSS